MKYYSSLDGIRALAVGTVLLAHSGPPDLENIGWVGVDAFFALSGFLITSILVAEHDRYGSICIRHFYFRRILRLFPCLLATVAGVLVVWGVAGYMHSVIKPAAFASTYLTNWAAAFGWCENGGPLIHTWSLANEEQFYLLWPLVIALACRCSKNRVGLGLIFLGAALLVAMHRWGMVRALVVPATRIHYALDTHADPMLIGSALACFLSARPGRPLAASASRVLGYVLAPIAAAFLVFILSNWISLHGHPVLTIGYPVVAVCAGIIITDLTLGGHSLLRALLSISVLGWVGRLSYGIYLYHLPIFKVLYKVGVHHWIPLLAAGAALTLLVSAASYYLMERRFLRLKTRFARLSEAGPVLRVELERPQNSGPCERNASNAPLVNQNRLGISKAVSYQSPGFFHLPGTPNKKREN